MPTERRSRHASTTHGARASVASFFSATIVGYGADPGFAVDTIMREVDAGAAALLGNHDDAIASGSVGMNSVSRRGARLDTDSAQQRAALNSSLNCR